MNKKDLIERDICNKFITPNIVSAGWYVDTQVREEVVFTDGRIYFLEKMHTRGPQKRADNILYYRAVAATVAASAVSCDILLLGLMHRELAV